jgi:hypothetical protein
MAIDAMALNGKVLCADGDGGPLKVARVEFKEDTNKDGDETLVLVLGGEATHALRHAGNPKLGAEPIFPDTLEPYVWEQQVRLGGNNQFAITNLNKTFRFENKLVDNDESIFRFAADHPESVLGMVKAKDGYVQLNVKEATDPTKYAPTVYAKFVSIAERKDAAEASVSYLRKKYGKKTAAADGVLAGTGTDLFGN